MAAQTSTLPIDISSNQPTQIFSRAREREVGLSRMLVSYIVAGLVFMLGPGTFLGVWNLIRISAHTASDAISPAWIQAHGHAQVFGWIGTFILGFGFYSLPKMCRHTPVGVWAPRVVLVL